MVSELWKCLRTSGLQEQYRSENAYNKNKLSIHSKMKPENSMYGKESFITQKTTHTHATI